VITVVVLVSLSFCLRHRVTWIRYTRFGSG